MFWWWCVDHAESGDLRQYNDSHLALAVELNPDQGKNFVEALVKSGFVERSPYFRIANWWKYSSRFMKQRYKDNPEKWQQIEKHYTVDKKKKKRTDTVTDTVTQETEPTEQNQQNQQNQQNKQNTNQQLSAAFELVWQRYPKKLGRKEALRHYQASVKTEQDIADIKKAVENYRQYVINNTVADQYIKHGSSWFNNWRDWIDYKGGQSGRTCKDERDTEKNDRGKELDALARKI